MTIEPNFKRECAGRSAAFMSRTLVLSTGRVRFFAIWRTKHYVDATTVSFPARNTRREMLVSICDSGGVFFFVFVFRSIGIGIATSPELFNKSLAFVVSLQGLESLAFFIGDDPANIFVHPSLVDLFRTFRLLLFRLLLLFLIAIFLC